MIYEQVCKAIRVTDGAELRKMANKSNKDWTQDLSPHLFWDADTTKIDPEKHAELIVQRILEYGLLKDWQLLKKHYGLEKI